MGRRWIALWCAIACTGCECGGTGLDLIIELRSDLVAGVEVDRVTTDVFPEGDRSSIFFSSSDITFGDPLESALRLAEIQGVAPGTYYVVVALEKSGAPVASRTVVATVTTTTVLTVLITRDCASVVCDDGSSCVAGVCVPDDCMDNPRSCPSAVCQDDTDCTTSVVCVTASCVESACAAFPNHRLCAGNEYCHPERGCVPLVDTMTDAGVGCPTEGCNDMNPCTDDACDGMRCVFTPNSAVCDDGMFCDGADQCGGGSCSIHPGDPCPGASTCNEASHLCMGCGTNADCPGETPGPWGDCAFASDCASNGDQSRAVTNYTCTGGTCQPTTRTESGPCSRESRENNVCGGTTCGGYGGCDYSDVCDADSTQYRTCTERRCRSGACADVDYGESRGCNRNTDGFDCGSGCGGWSGCDYEGGECDESGERTRGCDDRMCQGGGCRTSSRTEREDCNRGTEGNVCGSNPTYCGQATSCHVCRGGSCEVNTPHFDAACNPSCGAAADMCGTVGSCCSSSATGCPRVGPTWDCQVCCESTFCY